MLYKGLVTKSKSELLYVWSRNFGGEAVLDKGLLSTSERVPSLGNWIVFRIKEDSNLIDEFIDIPDILPTRVIEHGVVIVKTRISLQSSNVSGHDLLANSDDLGRVGIFQNFPNLVGNCNYDVWVERIPQSLSNLERLYKTSWYISEQLLEEMRKVPSRRLSQQLVFGSSSPIELPNSTVMDTDSSTTTHIDENSRSKSDFGFCEAQPERLSRQSYFTENFIAFFFQQQFFDSQSCTSTEGTEDDEIMESEEVVGLVTSSFNLKAFVWSSLGEGIISLSFGEQIRHGVWIKFIPFYINDACLQGNGGSSCKYSAKDWSITDPVYPTLRLKTTVSVQVKLFVPRTFRDTDGSSNLWAEFFGTVHDSLGQVAEYDSLNNVLGQCLLVRIMKMENNFGAGSHWVVHKILLLLKNKKSLPTLKSRSFAADALRYMNEDPHIHSVMQKVDWNLVEQVKEPHLLCDKF
uniref:Uncharacterized protein n=1 Tax=Setaria digitata TaxID=48799 RepID=A0A915PXZ1_9BILA